MTSSAPSHPVRRPAGTGATLTEARRVVVKIGSALVVDRSGVASARLASIGADIAGLRGRGVEVIIVSSGAVALGRGRLALTRRAGLDQKQAAAAVGQPWLMQAWEAALSPHGLIPAQVLLTREDTERRRRWLNARATMEALLKLGAVPVVNENDTVATEEIRYGDNDRLAARTAQLARADLLILLSDVDGLYESDPKDDPDARHIPLVEDLGPRVLAMAGGANAGAGVGTGGMRTKLLAADIARSAGCATVIASGSGLHPLAAIESGARATLITAPSSPLAAYKAWIAGSVEPAGSLTIDEGALAALASGGSLLPSGIRAVSGDFDKGDSILLMTAAGLRAGVGLAAYSAREMALIRGRKTGEVAALLGYQGPRAAVHRDDLVLQVGR